MTDLADRYRHAASLPERADWTTPRVIRIDFEIDDLAADATEFAAWLARLAGSALTPLDPERAAVTGTVVYDSNGDPNYRSALRP